MQKRYCFKMLCAAYSKQRFTYLLVGLSVILQGCVTHYSHEETNAEVVQNNDVDTANISLEQKAISSLAFLVGDWAGPGISYSEDGSEVAYHDTEFVRYDLDKNLLLINARGVRPDGSTSYSLHTVIYYDSEKSAYIYTPYRGNRVPRSFECQLNEKPQLRCYSQDKTYRLTFQRLADGRWNEYGERLVEGEWIKNFETKLTATHS